MKIVFMGTPDFSAKVLEILNASYPVYAVVTGLDKPVGRGYALKPSPLKIKAEELNIRVLQYEKVSKEGIEDIEKLAPDVVVTAAFGQILSERFLEIPRLGVLNVHASLLPKYRGSSPIQRAIINEDSETGITIMKTVKAVDAGDILLQKRMKIGRDETAGELFERLAKFGGEAIVEAIKKIEDGRAEFVPQDESCATHCSMISKSDGRINFDSTPEALDCFVRGMTPWPSAYTFLNGKILKVFKVVPHTLDLSDEPQSMRANAASQTPAGTVIRADEKEGIILSVKAGFVKLEEVQLEGGKRMSAKNFLRGNKIPEGYVFV